jgi:positive regulator of sigma E activity
VDILTIILVLLLVAALVGAVSFSEVIWVLVAFLLIVLALRVINTRGRF